MKNLNITEIEQEIENLKQQKRLKIRQEREAEKKRKQKLCYIVGELFIKYFPDILNITPGKKSENAINFAPLEQFFDMLASDKTTMEIFKECLLCTQDNQSNV